MVEPELQFLHYVQGALVFSDLISQTITIIRL